ncbi:MAG: hypothetical protein AAGJ28_19455 [Pseudomonadota bacterium]
MRTGFLVALVLFLGTAHAEEPESAVATDEATERLGKMLDAFGRVIENMPDSPRLIGIDYERPGIDPERPEMQVEPLSAAECGAGINGWRSIIGDFLYYRDPHFIEAELAYSAKTPGGKAVPDVLNQIAKTRRTYRHIPIRYEVDFCGSIENLRVGRAEWSVNYTGPEWSVRKAGKLSDGGGSVSVTFGEVDGASVRRIGVQPAIKSLETILSDGSVQKLPVRSLGVGDLWPIGEQPANVLAHTRKKIRLNGVLRHERDIALWADKERTSATASKPGSTPNGRVPLPRITPIQNLPPVEVKVDLELCSADYGPYICGNRWYIVDTPPDWPVRSSGSIEEYGLRAKAVFDLRSNDLPRFIQLSSERFVLLPENGDDGVSNRLLFKMNVWKDWPIVP